MVYISYRKLHRSRDTGRLLWERRGEEQNRHACNWRECGSSGVNNNKTHADFFAKTSRDSESRLRNKLPSGDALTKTGHSTAHLIISHFLLAETLPTKKEKWTKVLEQNGALCASGSSEVLRNRPPVSKPRVKAERLCCGSC